MERPVLAVLGGTGNLGKALACRWAKAGYQVIVGSRAARKAQRAAADIAEQTGSSAVRGLENPAAAAAAEIVVLTVPYESQRATLEAVKAALQGKILIDTTVPLVPPKVARVQLPPEGSAAKAAQGLLGDGVRVVSAFHNVAARHLAEAHDPDCDVLVFGDDRAAREAAVSLVEAAGMRGLHAGAIDNSVAAEAMTSVMIFINRHYKIDGASIRITGEPGAGPSGTP